MATTLFLKLLVAAFVPAATIAQEAAQAATAFGSVASALALTHPGVAPANLSLSAFVTHYSAAFSTSATQLDELSASALQEEDGAALGALLSQFAAGFAAMGSDLDDAHIVSSVGYHEAAAGCASLGGYFHTLTLDAAASAAYSTAAVLATIGEVIDALEPSLTDAPSASLPVPSPVSAWVRGVQKIGAHLRGVATGLVADLDATDAPGGGRRQLAPLRALQAARGPVVTSGRVDTNAVVEATARPGREGIAEGSSKKPGPQPDNAFPPASSPPSVITVPPLPAPPSPLATTSPAPPSSSPSPPAISPHVCPPSHPFRGCTNYDSTTYTYISSTPWKRYVGGIDVGLGIKIRGVGVDIGTTLCPDGGWWIRTNSFRACTTRKCVCACYSSSSARWWAWGGVNKQVWTMTLPCTVYKDNEYEWECGGAPPAIAPPPMPVFKDVGSGGNC